MPKITNLIGKKIRILHYKLANNKVKISLLNQMTKNNIHKENTISKIRTPEEIKIKHPKTQILDLPITQIEVKVIGQVEIKWNHRRINIRKILPKSKIHKGMGSGRISQRWVRNKIEPTKMKGNQVLSKGEIHNSKLIKIGIIRKGINIKSVPQIRNIIQKRSLYWKTLNLYKTDLVRNPIIGRMETYKIYPNPNLINLKIRIFHQASSQIDLCNKKKENNLKVFLKNLKRVTDNPTNINPIRKWNLPLWKGHNNQSSSPGIGRTSNLIWSKDNPKTIRLSKLRIPQMWLPMICHNSNLSIIKDGSIMMAKRSCYRRSPMLDSSPVKLENPYPMKRNSNMANMYPSQTQLRWRTLKHRWIRSTSSTTKISQISVHLIGLKRVLTYKNLPTLVQSPMQKPRIFLRNHISRTQENIRRKVRANPIWPNWANINLCYKKTPPK